MEPFLWAGEHPMPPRVFEQRRSIRVLLRCWLLLQHTGTSPNHESDEQSIISWKCLYDIRGLPSRFTRRHIHHLTSTLSNELAAQATV